MLRSRLALVICAFAIGIGLTVSWMGTISGQASVQATTLCVRPGGGGGCSATIAAAITAANSGDTIQVAAGVYTENLLINESVVLEGGWDAQFTIHDPATNVTTIRAANPDQAVVTIQGQFGQSDALTPTVDGFTITGARSSNHGGGLRINDSNAVIRDNLITDNTAYLFGGGIWVQRGAPLLENNQITHNRITPSGSAYGGGVELEGTQATMNGNFITNNQISSTVGYGGGLAIDGGGPVHLHNNTILNNAAANLAGGRTDYSYGGGVSVQNASVVMIDNLIQGNTANSMTKGFGGGLYVSNSPAFTLTNNIIMSNTAGHSPGSGPYLLGGGILVESSRGVLTGNVIIGNQANRNTIFGNGGGLAAITSTLDMQGGEVADNIVSRNCEGYGGGLYFKDSMITIDAVKIHDNCAANTPFYGKGGGLAMINSPITMTNALVSNNYAFGNDTAVGGLYMGVNSKSRLVNNTILNNRGQGIRTASPLTLTNNLIIGHTTGVSLTAAVPVSSTYNDFYLNTTPVRGFPFGATNIIINPQLDSSAHLTSGSPVIDIGSRTNAPSHDIDGQPRPMRGTSNYYRFDIGADEFSGAAQLYLDLDISSPDLTIIGPGNPVENPNSNGSNDWIGYSVLGADVNGDGQDDLIMAAEDFANDFDNPPFATGRLFGLSNFASSITGTIDLLTDTADLTVVGEYLLQHIGSDLISADLNGDTINDLILGSFEDDSVGNGMVTPTVFTLWGSSSLTGTRVLTDSTPADFMLRAPGQNFFSFSAKNALAAGDLNSDGLDDLIVGDYLADDGILADTGAIFVMFGDTSLTGMHDLASSPADYTLFGPGADAQLWHVATGMIDTDIEPDLVARTDSSAYVMLGPLSGGSLHLSSEPADITITGLQAGGVTLIDLTGDEQDDMILGSGNNLYVIPGPLVNGDSFDVSSHSVLTLTGALKASFAVSDVAGDDRPDLIIGVPSRKGAFVLVGGTTQTGTAPIEDLASTYIRSSTLSNLGYDVAAGDLDSDGRPDLIVSTWASNVDTHPNNFKDAGRVFVFYSQSLSLPLTPVETVQISGPPTGTVNLLINISAESLPGTASLPITYTWQTTGQPTIAHSGGLSDTMVFNWDTPGIKTISLQAANQAGSASDTFAILVVEPTGQDQKRVYLPEISK